MHRALALSFLASSLLALLTLSCVNPIDPAGADDDGRGPRADDDGSDGASDGASDGSGAGDDGTGNDGSDTGDDGDDGSDTGDTGDDGDDGSGTGDDGTGDPGAGSGGGGGTVGDSLGPCPGCRVYVPAGLTSSAPLLVALHGDEGRDFGVDAATAGVISMWREAADARGFIVLALACPASEGCNGAWSDHLASVGYQLPASTLSWLDDQVDAMEDLYDIDITRETLAGWSGGGYWLGYAAQARADRFSGVAFIAGGMPAYNAFHGCASCSIPGFFLGGDSDFRTEQMNDTAIAYDQCGQDVTTSLITNGTHQATIESLVTEGKALEILDWLAARPLACSP